MKKLAVLALIGALAMPTTVMADYDEDLWYLSHIIQAESGYCSEQMQQYVGSVVINRLNDPRFPNSIPEIINQPGQYRPVTDGALWNEPTQEVINVAVDLLENGSYLPPEVIYQANIVLGDYVYTSISTSYSTMYFCVG